MNYVIFNGKLLDERDVHISPRDRGFRYGDGVFDTLLVHGGRLYQWQFHLNRLVCGLAAVRIEFDVSILSSMCHELLVANNCEVGLLRIQITRGIGGRGYLPEARNFPTLLIETLEIPSSPAAPISLWQSDYCKVSPAALPVKFKICQGLNSTLARMEAEDNGCFDALLLNDAGQICETSSANVFWLKDDVLYTPMLGCGVLDGSVRSAVIRLSPYKICEIATNLNDFAGADAVFITNVAHKILAVNHLKPLGKNFHSEVIASQMLHLLEMDIARKTLN
jgi:branched-subunit amino acid aminotransferase/4-amino-4-deoxychorismate lyase